MPTTLALELAEQRARWRVRPGQSAPWAEELLRNEFLPEPEQKARQARALRTTLELAATLPYYKRLFRRERIDPTAPDALLRIPSLTRTLLQENAPILRNAGLPADQRDVPTRSSGTTGQPIEVEQSVHAITMFHRLKQRELRWFRFDPAGKMCTIRPAREFPLMKDGRDLPLRTVLRVAGWPYIGHLFETGPFAGFANTNLIEHQVEFVRAEAPHYLVMQSAGLEHLALASQGRGTSPNLRACLAISQTMTPAMRRTIEGALGAPVQQNYGFNEIGIVATRCPESGWYHVHAEHALVEVVDPEGRPVRPGENGRLLVTCLTNRAMPLVRYEPDDYAPAVEGPCPCGRTLPSFGDILGRYRRIALLPPGSWQRWAAIQIALHELPQDLKVHLRQYQAHQYANGTWVLRLHAPGAPFDTIAGVVRARFERAADGEPPPLSIVPTDQFEGKPQAKFQDFLSDFVPAPDAPESR